MTATKRKPAAKAAPVVRKLDITKLSTKQLNALDEETFLASLPADLRRWVEAAWKLKGHDHDRHRS